MRPGVDGTSGLGCSMRLDRARASTMPNGNVRDTLLELDAVVHCDEDIILTGHSAQQLAVLDPAPAAAGHGVYGSAARPMGRCSSSSRRIGREGFAREVE